MKYPWVSISIQVWIRWILSRINTAFSCVYTDKGLWLFQREIHPFWMQESKIINTNVLSYMHHCSSFYLLQLLSYFPYFGNKLNIRDHLHVSESSLANVLSKAWTDLYEIRFVYHGTLVRLNSAFQNSLNTTTNTNNFCNPILFAICTNTFSKLSKNLWCSILKISQFL
jgi:hypothetical protein